jgi:hypothetical protein
MALLCFFEIVHFSKATRCFRDFWLLFTVAFTAAVFPLHAEENKKSSTDFVASLFEKTTTTFTVKPNNKPMSVEWTYTNKGDIPLVIKASIACIGNSGCHPTPRSCNNSLPKTFVSPVLPMNL